jgi:hypothetical protein
MHSEKKVLDTKKECKNKDTQDEVKPLCQFKDKCIMATCTFTHSKKWNPHDNFLIYYEETYRK